MKPISDARTCKDGCTYLQGRLHVLAKTDAKWRLFPQTFAGAVYNVCIRGCKRYPWRTHVFAFKVDQIGPGGCSALQGRMQCTAGAVAVHCGGGCSALRGRWAKLAPKSSVLFWTREKGGETRPIWVTVAPLIYLLNPFYWAINWHLELE